MISLTKILNKLYLTKFSFYLLLTLILISFSITFYLMLPNNNLVKNPLQLQYFLLADVFFVILLLILGFPYLIAQSTIMFSLSIFLVSFSVCISV